jgi:hypothetical protein
MVDQPLDFFISYTARDETWATWVAQRLELAGYRVVLQAWDFRGGNFVVRMEDAIQRAEWLIAILSERYLGSKWGREEWASYMRTAQPSIIPVQIEDVTTRSLLRSLQRVNLVGLAERVAEDRLLAVMAEIAGPPSHEPRERPDVTKSGFPGISYEIPMGTAIPQDGGEAPEPPVPVDRDHIQLVLLGYGDAAEAVTSFRRLLAIPDERCRDLFGSGLPADEQLAQLKQIMQDLDPEAVSDVLVVFAGTGSKNPDAGVQLQVRAIDPARPATSVIGLASLLDCLQDDRYRSCVILDAVDGQGEPVNPTVPNPVPVLTLGREGAGGHGLAAIHTALTLPPQELAGKLRHWGPLSLQDLRVLAGGQLVAVEDSPPLQVGLIPSPLAWSREGADGDRLANWCAVVSESDARKSEGDSVDLIVDKLAAQSRAVLNTEYRRLGYAIELAASPGKLLAGNVLSSPRSFAHAVEQVCRAELAVFDLTNFEPAVMILLGIRAVIRRGLTVCVAREHDPPWRDAEPPFHLREVNLVKEPDRDKVEARVLEGIKQLAQPGSSYTDLPCFDLVRGVSPDPEQRQIRSFDAERSPSILALVPFDQAYGNRNWKQIVDSLPATARGEIMTRRGGPDEVRPPALRRSLDLTSPRVVSAQLFEAIRLTDFCLVDVTSARPNVLFELGVRLVANRLDPVVIVDLSYPPGDSADWLTGVEGQLKMLRRLLQPVQYTPNLPDVYALMVQRHVEFRRLLSKAENPRAQSLLGGLPLAGVYDIAWQHAVDRDEVVTMPVAQHLQSGGEDLLVNQTRGQRHLIYPTYPDKHRLTDAAEKTGREYLIAAWLYLHFRARENNNGDSARTSELTRRYQALGDELMLQLGDTGVEADASFAGRMEQWLNDENGPAGQKMGGEDD